MQTQKELINELSKHENVTIYEDCGLYKKHEVTIKEKFTKEKSPTVELPSSFKVLIIED